jgi:hypothetical protein
LTGRMRREGGRKRTPACIVRRMDTRRAPLLYSNTPASTDSPSSPTQQPPPSPHTHTPTHILSVQDPGDPSFHNAEFHLCELPPDIPSHLIRLLPNLQYSDALGDRRFAVLVTAARSVYACVRVWVGGVHVCICRLSSLCGL